MRSHSYENDFYLHENETACRTHHMKGFALTFVLKQRHKNSEMAYCAIGHIPILSAGLELACNGSFGGGGERGGVV